MADAARFWNRLAKSYARQPISDEAAYRHKLEITQNYLSPGARVLEFGCGTGGTALIHAPHVAGYRATDISDEMIRIARERAGQEAPEALAFEVADFDKMELEPGSLDAVLGMSILHLVPDPAQTIAKVHRCLASGGFFVSSTPCVGTMWPLRILAPIGQALGLIPPLSFFTDARLRDMMRAAGFDIVEDWQPGKGKALFLVARKAD